MDRRRLAVVAAVVAAAVAAIVVLLLTGEAEPVRTFEDRPGDAMFDEGENPPTDTTLADIRSAEVRAEGGEVVFDAQLAGPIPNELPDGTLDLRWEIYEGGDSTFLITANLDVGPVATVIGERNDYGANTLDETLPGTLTIVEDRLTIRLDTGEIPDFPQEFAWLLHTSLDADQGDAQSARAEDRAPDDGFGEYPAR
ncbi:MAG TPA: hypothetical protein VG318_13525 [Actinomycetota bacterium]|nr:hypothetical protein [Actinomycetota bacterium]